MKFILSDFNFFSMLLLKVLMLGKKSLVPILRTVRHVVNKNPDQIFSFYKPVLSRSPTCQLCSYALPLPTYDALEIHGYWRGKHLGTLIFPIEFVVLDTEEHEIGCVFWSTHASHLSIYSCVKTLVLVIFPKSNPWKIYAPPH